MGEKVLLVDDEERVLEGYGRTLRRHFDLVTVTAGDQALARLQANGSFGVLVADMRMPNMNGIELLAEARRRFPDVVRIMLTGNADQRTAVDAVNRGEIFRFLNKPCPPDELARAINAGLSQHKLVVAERELLEHTLRGSVAALSEVLGIVNPAAFGSAERLSALMGQLAQALELSDSWLYETLGRLSQVGCVVLPESLVEKVRGCERLGAEEQQRFERHPAVGAELIGRIPRLEQVAEGIRYQLRNYDGSGAPADGPLGEQIPVAARLLRVAVEYERQHALSASAAHALLAMRAQARCFDPAVLEALAALVDEGSPETPIRVALRALREGMVFAEDLRTSKGVLIVSRGQLVTSRLRDRLHSFIETGQIPESVAVTAKLAEADGRGRSPRNA